MKKAYLNWSSGKDAAFALHKILHDREYIVDKLITTVNSENDRISMHGVRKRLLQIQAKNVGIPLEIISFDGNVPMSTYNEVMLHHNGLLRSQGYDYGIFGDIFIDDLRTYREDQLKKVGIKTVFPLWKKDTHDLLQDFINSGFKAIVVCVNSKLLDKSYCGKIIDEDFLSSLPVGVDPCGENGEFHTFVFDGPIFVEPVKFRIGEVVEKFYHPHDEEDNCFKKETERWDTAFWYCDLIPD